MKIIMQMFLPLLCIIPLALAEPPIGDGYALAHSSLDHGHNHDHGNDFHRSISQEYGPSSLGARSIGSSQNALSTEYGPPNTRTASLKSSLSKNYGAPNHRSGISQEYGVPNVRSSSSYTPASRGISNTYGVPDTRSQLSQTYGVPAVRSGISSLGSDISRTLATEYGAPELRSPSEEYGLPSQRSFGRAHSQKQDLPSARNPQTDLSQEYGVPSAKSNAFHQRQNSYQNIAKSFASSSSRSFKGAAEFGSRSLSNTYGVPARNSGYSQSTKALSQTYGAPSHQDLSDTYEAPNARALSQEYGVPSSYAANQKTSAIASSYSAAARSSPSETYGVPSGRDFMPSEQYGVPDQYDSLPNQGYSYARDALNEILNQEPANYDFAYKVNDYESGSDFGHTETRQDNRAEGSYFVVLPDGTKQVVEYEADERGFKPKISVEPADLGRSGGYDDNAADLARSSGGPY